VWERRGFAIINLINKARASGDLYLFLKEGLRLCSSSLSSHKYCLYDSSSTPSKYSLVQALIFEILDLIMLSSKLYISISENDFIEIVVEMLHYRSIQNREDFLHLTASDVFHYRAAENR